MQGIIWWRKDESAMEDPIKELAGKATKCGPLVGLGRAWAGGAILTTVQDATHHPLTQTV